MGALARGWTISLVPMRLLFHLPSCSPGIPRKLSLLSVKDLSGRFSTPAVFFEGCVSWGRFPGWQGKGPTPSVVSQGRPVAWCWPASSDASPCALPKCERFSTIPMGAFASSCRKAPPCIYPTNPVYPPARILYRCRGAYVCLSHPVVPRVRLSADTL